MSHPYLLQAAPECTHRLAELPSEAHHIFKIFIVMHKTIFIITVLVLLFAQTALSAGVDLLHHKKGIWSIACTAEKNRWVVIHNLKEAKETGIYHIEVLARGSSEPTWKVEHVVKHMAITQSALAANVLKPLDRGAVYPETFDTAFHDWQQQNSGKGGRICNTSLDECMEVLKHNADRPDGLQTRQP